MTTLDKAFLAVVTMPILRVWGEVSCDAGPTSKRDAMEIAIDANRLTSWGYPEADTLISAAIQEHGYDHVLRYLVRHINL